MLENINSHQSLLLLATLQHCWMKHGWTWENVQFWLDGQSINTRRDDNICNICKGQFCHSGFASSWKILPCFWDKSKRIDICVMSPADSLFSLKLNHRPVHSTYFIQQQCREIRRRDHKLLYILHPVKLFNVCNDLLGLRLWASASSRLVSLFWRIWI